MACEITNNDRLALMKGDITHEELSKKLMACNRSVHLNSSARIDFTKDRNRTKEVKNLDQLFKKINDLKANGVMDMYVKKFGPIGHQKKLNESALFKIEKLLENAPVAAGTVVSGSAVAVAPYSGTPGKDKPTPIINTYPGKTTQDQGAETRKK